MSLSSRGAGLTGREGLIYCLNRGSESGLLDAMNACAPCELDSGLGECNSYGRSISFGICSSAAGFRGIRAVRIFSNGQCNPPVRNPFEIPLVIPVVGRRWLKSIARLLHSYKDGVVLRHCETRAGLLADPTPHIGVEASTNQPGRRPATALPESFAAGR